MARKSVEDLKRKPSGRDRSWACVGMDTSMSSIAMVSMIYDAVLDKMIGPTFRTIRWTEEDYFERLLQANRLEETMLVVVPSQYVTMERTFIAIEEPFYYGAVKRGQSGWIKQQAEVSGAAKAGLLRWGWRNLYEINNQSWYKTIRDEGHIVRKGKEGKWDVKTWAIQAFGLPDLPDLVQGKHGKIPRPESGYGAKAKPVQPEDIYDAAGLCAWMLDTAETGGLL